MKYNIGISDKKPGSHKSGSNNLQMSSSNLIKSGGYRKVRKFNPFNGFHLGKRNDLSKPNTKSKIGAKPGKRSFKKAFKKVLLVMFGFFFFLAVVGAVIIGIYLKQIEAILPKPGTLLTRTFDQSTIIYDRNGKELYRIYPQGDINAQNRQYIKLADLPATARRNIIVAVLAAEDVNFYTHKGIDILGVVRCGILSVKSYITQGSGDEGCGASTISQQLVRNTILADVFGDEAYNRSTFLSTADRKAKEILMTMQVEQTLTKDQILEMYLNEVMFGNVNYGIQEGTKYIFDKDAKDLTLAQAAILAGIIQAPSRFNPINGSEPDQAAVRQAYVFEQLKKHKDTINADLEKEGLPTLSDDDINNAMNEKIVYKQGNIDLLAPHFVFYVRQQLIDKYGIDQVERGGLRVTTTLDYTIQKITEDEIFVGTKLRGRPYNVWNGAGMVVDPKTGQILSMVGSVNYNDTKNKKIDGNVNVLLSERQMGSSVKPIVYLTAFEKGLGPWMAAPDIKQFKFGNYDPNDWDFKFMGSINARLALGQSRNVSAIYTMQYIGVDAFIQTAEKIGITTLTNRSNYGLSLGLGAGGMKMIEHIQTYDILASEGIKRPLVSILKVTDSNGKVLDEFKNDQGQRVFDEKDVYLMNWTLCDLGGFNDTLVNSFYQTNGKRFVCGKTGTTDGPKDLTAFVYTKNIVVGVWNGNNNNVEVPGASSSTVPLPIAASIARRLLGKYPSVMFSRPAGISTTTVCSDTGAIPGTSIPGAVDDCPRTSSVYIVGRGPRPETRDRITVCKDTGLVPSNLDFATANGLTKTVDYLQFALDNTAQQDNWQAFMGTKGVIFKIPDTGECILPLGPGNTAVIGISSPATGTSFKSGDLINFSVAANSANAILNVQYKMDGVNIAGGSIATAPFGFTYTVPASLADGAHTVSAILTDSLGLTATASISITITPPTPVVTLTLTMPATANLSTFPVSINVAQSGGTVASVSIHIAGVGYSKDVAAVNSGANWIGSWDKTTPTVAAGSYTVQATSNTGVVSNVVTVTVN